MNDLPSSEKPKPTKLKLAPNRSESSENKPETSSDNVPNNTPAAANESRISNPARAVAEATKKDDKPSILLTGVVTVFLFLLVLVGIGLGFRYLFSGESRSLGNEPQNEEAGLIGKVSGIISKLPFNQSPADDEEASDASSSNSFEIKEPEAGGPTPNHPPKKTWVEAVSRFLNDARIEGVRTGSEARVLINGENYRIGDVIDKTTGLIFIGVKEKKLEFQDRDGTVYGKGF